MTSEEKALDKRASGALQRNEVRELMKRFLEEADADERLEWDKLTTRDGLPHNWIYDLFEDSRGRMWVGTWGGGLGLYEQGRWRVYTRRHGLAGNAVTCIREDADGGIWVATDTGLSRMRGGEFTAAGLTGLSILNLTFDRDQRLWAGCWRAASTGGGLFRLDSPDAKRFTPIDEAPGLEVLKVFEDSRGHVWIGTYDHGQGAGVGQWDGRRWRRFTRRDGLVHDCVYSMFEDPEGRMWFGTLGGVSIYDGTKWHCLTKKDGLVNDRVYSMFIDRDKKMWFGTEGGVSRFDGQTWKSYTTRDGLVADLTRVIEQDREGTLWFGSYPYSSRKGGITRARRPIDRQGIADRALRFLPQRGTRRQIGS
jgi:ligand-binding sensor domain-containing protein